MKKLFISQPMIDKTDIEIFQEINRVIDTVTKKFGEELDLLNSYISEDPPEGVNIGLWYLSKSLGFLAQADVAYFVKGWENYRGCKYEHKAATEYGIPVIITEDE